MYTGTCKFAYDDETDISTEETSLCLCISCWLVRQERAGKGLYREHTPRVAHRHAPSLFFSVSVSFSLSLLLCFQTEKGVLVYNPTCIWCSLWHCLPSDDIRKTRGLFSALMCLVSPFVTVTTGDMLLLEHVHHDSTFLASSALLFRGVSLGGA